MASQEIFLQWVETILERERQPHSISQKCSLLLVDGSKTHLTLQGAQEIKFCGAKVVVPPPPPLPITDVMRPFDKAIFKAMKASFREKDGHSKRKNHHRAISLANFVQLWKDAAPPQNIRAGFSLCGITLFDQHFFLERCLPERIKQQDLPACPATLAHSMDASQYSSQNSSPSAVPSQVSTKRVASTQCSGRGINAATHDDRWLLRLGGFVKAQDFCD